MTKIQVFKGFIYIAVLAELCSLIFHFSLSLNFLLFGSYDSSNCLTLLILYPVGNKFSVWNGVSETDFLCQIIIILL